MLTDFYAYAYTNRLHESRAPRPFEAPPAVHPVGPCTPNAVPINVNYALYLVFYVSSICTFTRRSGILKKWKFQSIAEQ